MEILNQLWPQISKFIVLHANSSCVCVCVCVCVYFALQASMSGSG
jgi:hypothetical protein